MLPAVILLALLVAAEHLTLLGAGLVFWCLSAGFGECWSLAGSTETRPYQEAIAHAS